MTIIHSAMRTKAAEQRGYDRAFTIFKSGEYLTIDPAEIAGRLYPDAADLRSACGKGLRNGWNDAVASMGEAYDEPEFCKDPACEVCKTLAGPVVFDDPVDLLAPTPDPVIFLNVSDPFPCLRCDVKASVPPSIFCATCTSLVDAAPAEPVERSADQ